MSLRRFFALGAAFGLSVLASLTASAAPVISISGNYSGASFTSPTLTFTGGTVASVFPAGPPPTVFGSIAQNFSINLSNYSADNVPGNALPSSLVLSFSDPASATFSLLGLATLEQTAATAGQLLAFYSLTSSSGADFGPIGGVWDFLLTFNNIALAIGNPGSATPGATQSASFSLNFIRPPNIEIPEPTTFMVWSSMAVAGFFARRRFKKAA